MGERGAEDVNSMELDSTSAGLGLARLRPCTLQAGLGDRGPCGHRPEEPGFGAIAESRRRTGLGGFPQGVDMQAYLASRLGTLCRILYFVFWENTTFHL